MISGIGSSYMASMMPSYYKSKIRSLEASSKNTDDSANRNQYSKINASSDLSVEAENKKASSHEIKIPGLGTHFDTYI